MLVRVSLANLLAQLQQLQGERRPFFLSPAFGRERTKYTTSMPLCSTQPAQVAVQATVGIDNVQRLKSSHGEAILKPCDARPWQYVNGQVC